MNFARLLCTAALGILTAPALADPATRLAATDMGSPTLSAQDDAAHVPNNAATAALDGSLSTGHQASDGALSAAEPETTPAEILDAKPLERPDPTLFADIDLTTQTMSVKDADGNTYGPWKISSARGGYKTPTGTYTVHYTARMHYSKQYHWSPMPYSVFFNEGVAVHGTNALGNLGRPASHGCVRTHPKNAKTFYDLVQKHGKELTQVVVRGTPPYSPAVAERRTRSRYQQPTYAPFGFFAAQPPSYEPRRRRYQRQQQYGGGYYGAW